MNYPMAFALLLLSYPPSPLLVLDAEMNKPVQPATAFTPAQYLKGFFPIYEAEAAAVIDGVDKVARLMDREWTCYQSDTVAAGHTMLILTRDCESGQSFSVMLQTTVDESQASFALTLVKQETNRRKAQQKVLDFATYLEQ